MGILVTGWSYRTLLKIHGSWFEVKNRLTMRQKTTLFICTYELPDGFTGLSLVSCLSARSLIQTNSKIEKLRYLYRHRSYRIRTTIQLHFMFTGSKLRIDYIAFEILRSLYGHICYRMKLPDFTENSWFLVRS